MICNMCKNNTERTVFLSVAGPDLVCYRCEKCHISLTAPLEMEVIIRYWWNNLSRDIDS